MVKSHPANQTISEIPLGAEPYASPECRDLDVTTLPLHVVLKDATSVVEGIGDDRIEVLTSGCRTRAISHHEVRTGNRYLDANAMGFTVPMPMVRRLDGYTAARDAVGESLELGGSATDVFFDGWRCLDATEGDLDGDLHVRLL
jgi:hypothetical protein